MAQRSFSINVRELCFRSSCASSPTQAIAERTPHRPPPGVAIGSSKSSSATNCTSSSFCPRDGSSSAPLNGSTDAEGWPRIGRISTARHSPSCTSLQFASCCESYAIPPKVSGQTLRPQGLRPRTAIGSRRPLRRHQAHRAPAIPRGALSSAALNKIKGLLQVPARLGRAHVGLLTPKGRMRLGARLRRNDLLLARARRLAVQKCQ